MAKLFKRLVKPKLKEVRSDGLRKKASNESKEVKEASKKEIVRVECVETKVPRLLDEGYKQIGRNNELYIMEKEI